MRGSTYYRLATFAPFALPIAGLLAGGLMALLDLPGAQAVVTVFGFLGVAAWIGGFPYLITAGIALWRLRGKPVSEYRRAAWLIPWPYSAFLGVIFFVIALTEEEGRVFAAAGIGAAWAACGLGFGYFYVFLVQWLYRLLQRKGVVVDES